MLSETWENRYRDGDTPWDKGSPAPAIDEAFANTPLPENARVLIPGCGTGHDVRKIASLGYTAVGLDISPSALAEAKKSTPTESNCEFLLGDFFDPQFSNNKYDAIWEHTCFCAIDPELRNAYVDTCHQLLKNGGVLIGVFFINTGMPEGEGPPFETSTDALYDYFSNKFDLLWEKSPSSHYPGREDGEWLMAWRTRT